MKSIFLSLLFFTSLTMMASSGQGNCKKELAFPGAEGAGKYTTGGRGGEVVFVTNLNDDGPGSLRKAIRKHGPRIIVFKVSGNIELKSHLDINNDDITIAGQTAPGDGICLTGYTLKVKANNVIIRYIRCRPGDLSGDEIDAFTCKDTRNVIVDHCSFSWGNDEVCSVYDNEHCTIQWCLISESMNHSDHHKGDHGYGGIWGGKTASFIGNLFAHHISRNPRLHGSRYHKQPEKERAELVNNVMYNWRDKCMYAGEAGHYSLVSNYFKPGPATKESARDEFMDPYPPFSYYYISGNIMEGYPEVTAVNTKGVDEVPDTIFTDTPFNISDYQPLSAEDAFEKVLTGVGASFNRDAVDSRIVEEVRNGNFTYGDEGIIDSQKDVGGWPELKAEETPIDSDNDGIPDSWEKTHGLDAGDSDDNNKYDLSEHYTNIEVWMNSLVE